MIDTDTISFFVPGIARPGGSKTASAIYGRDGKPVLKNGRVITTTREAGKYTGEWRAVVALTARVAMGQDAPLDGALQLDVVFTMPRPKNHYRSNGALKDSVPTYHTCKPDCTKLLRALEDAMTGIVMRDDALIAVQSARKVYGENPGALVTITGTGSQ